MDLVASLGGRGSLVLLFLLCAGVALLVGLAMARRQVQAMRQLLAQAEERRQAETEAMLDGVKLAFADISGERFARLSEQLLQNAQSTLSAERRLQGHEMRAERAELEARIQGVLGQLERMQGLVREIERDREAKFGRLEERLEATGNQAGELVETTRRLAQTLTNSRARGQWGERLAEDVLRRAGMVEGISYRRQTVLADGGRPDFTFLLPDGLTLHMDVKFPFENWQRSLEATESAAQLRLEQAFLRDARGRIAELAARGYIAPDQGTLDVALLFLPNEDLASSLWRLAPDLMDEALAKGIVIVSPLTLFAVLAIIRRTLQSFRLSQATRDLASAVTGFRSAWADLSVDLDKLGGRIEDLARAHRTIVRQRTDRLDRHLAALDQQLTPAAMELSTPDLTGGMVPGRGLEPPT